MRLTFGNVQRIAAALGEYSKLLNVEADQLQSIAAEFENTKDSGLPGVLRMRAVNYARIAALFESASVVELVRHGEEVAEPPLNSAASAHLIEVVKFHPCSDCPCDNMCRLYAKCGQSPV